MNTSKPKYERQVWRSGKAYPMALGEQTQAETAVTDSRTVASGKETVRQWKERINAQTRIQHNQLLDFAQSIAKLDSAAVNNGLIPVETWKRIHARAQSFNQ